MMLTWLEKKRLQVELGINQWFKQKTYDGLDSYKAFSILVYTQFFDTTVSDTYDLYSFQYSHEQVFH